MSRLFATNTELAERDEQCVGDAGLNGIDHAGQMRQADALGKFFGVRISRQRNILVAKGGIVLVVIKFNQHSFRAAVGAVGINPAGHGEVATQQAVAGIAGRVDLELGEEADLVCAVGDSLYNGIDGAGAGDVGNDAGRGLIVNDQIGSGVVAGQGQCQYLIGHGSAGCRTPHGKVDEVMASQHGDCSAALREGIE